MVATILIFLIALLHIWIVVLEMALWTRPVGRRTFGTTPEFAAASKALAANQGLYNGFLVAGLLWSLVIGPPERIWIASFFLICVLVAGIFGAVTVKPRILFVQAVPAALALVALYAGV